jgi:hypothetical protein
VSVAALYGVAVVWLLAAVVCCLRRQWLLFICGFFTFGLAWFVGAVAGSTFRRVAVGAGAVAIVAIVLGAFAARPAPVLGIDGASLQRSVGGRLAEAGGVGCKALSGPRWRCYQYDDSGGGWLAVPVRVNGRGCWRATDRTRRSPDVEGENRGCVHLGDYL